ncbi:MAG: DUF3365 domain-containing protein [Desulfobacter sp.]|nr:MAG: DUF3365 domain-containing protein [Desulfobacter sp.]
MRDSGQSNSPASFARGMRFYAVMLAVVWAAVIASSLAWNIFQTRKTIRLMAVKEARSHFNKDQAARFWATAHGGVYVPVDERTPPNPHLSHIPEQNIITPSGKKLTLMNPAYMLRQMMDEYAGLYGVKGRITSLKPFREENLPDPWERAALQAFESGGKEVFEYIDINGQPHLRLIQPMFTKEECLKCHAKQGYKVGDIRGGVGISIPMAPYLAYERGEIRKLALSHFVIFMVGMAGIHLGYRKLSTAFALQLEAEQKQKQLTDRLEALLAKLPVGIVVIDYDTRAIVDANPHALSVFGCALEKLAGKICTDYICPADKKNCPVIDQGLHLDKSEREILTYDGQRVPVLKTVITTEIDDRKVLLECFIDITDKKKAEKELLEKERLQVVLEMAGGVCHEFNQPLQVIAGNCELLADDGELDKTIEKALRNIAEAADRMGGMTRNLMNLTTYRTKPYLNSQIADITPRDLGPDNDSGGRGSKS